MVDLNNYKRGQALERKSRQDHKHVEPPKITNATIQTQTSCINKEKREKNETHLQG